MTSSPSPDGDEPKGPDPEGGAPAERYGARAVSSAAMLAGLRVGARLLGAVQLLIFSRICGETSTGVIGIGLLVLFTLETFSQFGLRKALIQRRDEVREHYGTVFTFQAVRGGVLAVALFFTAPWIAEWFREPSATPVLRAFALVPLIRGFTNIAIIEFDRRVKLGRAVLIEAGAPVLDFAVTIAWLIVSPGVMALVWGKVAGVVAIVVLSFLLARESWRPGWSTARFRELLSFGAWVFATGVVTLLVTRGADFVVGRMLSTAEMGIYTLATMLAVLPMLEINTVVGRVVFPAYSRMQDDPARLRSAFLRSFLVVSTVVVGVATLIIVGAADFVSLVLGGSWAELGAIIPLMAVWGACRAMGGATASVFFAVGKPMWVLYYHAVMLVMFVVLLVPMAKGAGLPGVAWTLAAVGLAAQTIRYPLIARFVSAPVSELYARTFVPMLASAIAIVASWVVVRAVPADQHLIRLILATLIGGTVYLLGLLVWDRTSKVDVFRTLLSVVPERFRPRRLT